VSLTSTLTEDAVAEILRESKDHDRLTAPGIDRKRKERVRGRRREKEKQEEIALQNNNQRKPVDSHAV
jgi:hypothetical protein